MSSSDDKTVMVWEINHSARKLNKFARLHAGGWLECVAITSQGNLIAAGDNYGTVKIWHLEDGNWTEFDTFETVKDFVLPQEYRPKDILHVTGDNVGCINISFSLDNLILLVSRGDGMIGIYKKQAGRGHDKFSDVFLSSVVAHEISRDDGLVEVFAEILSDSKTILSVGDNHLRVWDIQKVQPEFITEYPLNGTGRRFICEADKVIISTWNGWVDIFHSPGKTAGSSSALHWCRSGLTPLAKMWHGSRVDGFILNERLPSILVYGDDEGNVGTWKIIDAS